MDFDQLMDLAHEYDMSPVVLAEELGIDFDAIATDEGYAPLDVDDDGFVHFDYDLNDPSQFRDAWHEAYGADADYIGDDDAWNRVYAWDMVMEGATDVNDAMAVLDQEVDEIHRVLDLVRDGYSVEDALAAVRV